MRIAIGAALICVVAAASACRGSNERHVQLVISHIDGVLHVHLPSGAPVEAPRWRYREIYNTSNAGTAVELFRVVAARFLEDGSLAIANSGNRELLYLNGAGRLERRFGREGSGPGEFSMMAALDVDESGNLLVYDPRLARLTRVTSTGDVLATERLSSENSVVDLYPLSELADGRFVFVFGAVRVFGRTGELRDTVPLVVISPAGAQWDTLGTWPAQEWANFEYPGGVTRTEVGFGRRLAYSGRAGRVALGSTDSLDIAVFDNTGRHSMRITGWGSSEQVRTDAVDRWRTELLNNRSRAPEEIRRWLSTAPHRTTYPAFQDILVDARGRIWIGMFPRASMLQDWIVIGSDGQLEGQLSLPAESQLLDATADRVALVRRNGLDEEYIVVMAIDRDG